MAMSILNNTGAQLSLGQLNKNINRLSKTLARLSNGERLTDAGDGDSSSYAISERMREQIRSLAQDNQNVQNGSAILRTAERGINQVVEELRTLKELAIDAANDSNTEEDRRTIQKEVDQRMETIDELAIDTNYNGKILLDGRYGKTVEFVMPGDGGLNTNFNTNIAINFSPKYNASTSSRMNNGGWGKWAFTADQSFEMTTTGTAASKAWTWADAWKAAGRGNATTDHRAQMAVELNFDTLQSPLPFPECLHKQGFTILCGACHQYINVIFDSSIAANESSYDRNYNEDNYLAREFIIGVKDVQDASELPEAIFQGIQKQAGVIKSGGDQNTPDNTAIDAYHDLRIARDPADPKKILFIKSDNFPLQFLDGTIPNPMPDDWHDNPQAALKTEWKGQLWIQHGTQAGQRVNVYINSMQTKDLGIRGASVLTRDDAVSTIGVLDNALKYALNEATTMGAWLNRLEYTDSNVTIMGENVTNAESTIRDADMAKEMTNFTKNNVLSQAAQAMLAQSNQNSSSILSLLQ